MPPFPSHFLCLCLPLSLSRSHALSIALWIRKWVCKFVRARACVRLFVCLLFGCLCARDGKVKFVSCQSVADGAGLRLSAFDIFGQNWKTKNKKKMWFISSNRDATTQHYTWECVASFPFPLLFLTRRSAHHLFDSIRWCLCMHIAHTSRWPAQGQFCVLL